MKKRVRDCVSAHVGNRGHRRGLRGFKKGDALAYNVVISRPADTLAINSDDRRSVPDFVNGSGHER